MAERSTTPRLILHIGVQKTASTAVQNFMGQNKAALAPYLTVFTPWRGTPSQLLGRRAIDYTFNPTPETESALVAAIGDMRAVLDAQTGPCLISHENLVGAAPGSMGETRLYPYIDRILALLDTHLAPFRPHYVYYSREMAGWKRSVHNQIVKTDGYAGTWDDYRAQTDHITRWDDFDQRLRAAAGTDRVTRLRLEDEPDTNRPGQLLLQAAGVPASVLSTLRPLDSRRNESLNAGSLEFMRRVNAEGFAPGVRYRLGLLVAACQPLFSPSVDATRD